MALGTTVPTSDVDLFSDESLIDPYPHYDALRETGPVVYLEQVGVYALTQDETVRRVLNDHEGFSSQQGVALNDMMNQMSGGGSIITVDPPLHNDVRRAFQKPLRPSALRDVAERIRAEADALIDDLKSREEFDGVVDLACHLPVTIVSHMLGYPEEGRERMLEWATAVFDMLGPDTPRGREGMMIGQEMLIWADSNVRPDKVSADGWAQQMFDTAAAGDISDEWAHTLAKDFMFPSLDTTINATSSLLYLLATHPEQWELLKSDHSLIPKAIGETIRLETPVQFFSRVATRPVELDGVQLDTGDRVMVMYGSANRDEARWERATKFDITRPDATRHVGFGAGQHSCVGQGLALLEMQSLLEAMVAKVDRIEIGEPVRRLNQTMRGLAHLPMRFV